MPFEMDEHSGDIMRMRRYSRLSTAPVPLGPAMNNPPVQTLTAVDLDAKIDWYASYIIITKNVTLINEDKERVLDKPFLIDLEAYVSQEAA